MKQRIDELLVARELAPDLKAAAAMVMAGEVSVSEQLIAKPGAKVNDDAEIRIKQRSRFVSRGGDKLASVLEPLHLDFAGKTVVDVGSSTGGFTDVALQYGASRVYCVDVGNAQLAYKLRQDPRVVVMERTDIRSVFVIPANVEGSNLDSDKSLDSFDGDSSQATPSNNNYGSSASENSIPEVDLALIDVSFISLTKILDTVAALVKPNGLIVAMMKPQFEADKATADRYKGVISDETIREELINEFRDTLKDRFDILDEADSGVAGLHGNRERFFVLSSRAEPRDH